MVFSSLSFLIFFIPCTVVLYFLFKNRTYRNVVLLLASLLFYSWGEPKFVLLMFLSTLIAYLGGLCIGKRKNKFIFILTVFLILLSLFIFKYLNFALETAGVLTGHDLRIKQIALPIGISFYTFQILSYVIDLYRGNIKVQKNYFYLLLYVCFFPQLIAGPIVRYSTIESEILNRQENIEDAKYGVKRFIIGLAKKVLIANQVAKLAEIVYAAPSGTYDIKMLWLAAIAFTLQLYFDFSGYSDMAIGLGRIFGFHFLENFDHPYISKSITEFWRRWHISLASWFKDYVYIPLGGNKHGLFRQIINIFIVWALTGLWHGASWNFVLWGLYNAVLLCIEKLFLGKLLDKLPGIISWIYAFFVTNMGCVLFNITDFRKLVDVVTGMFTLTNVNFMDMLANNTGIVISALFIPLGLILMFPVGKLTKKIENCAFGEFISDVYYIALLAICVVFVLSSSYNPFIYFRF